MTLPKKRIRAKVLTMLFGALGISISLSGWQAARTLAGDYKIEKHTKSLLSRAEEVEDSLTGALDDLNNKTSLPCKNEDLDTLRRVSYEYRFIEDAGRIYKNTIPCSAMMSTKTYNYKIQGTPKTNEDNLTIWENTQTYLSPKVKMKIVAKGNYFVVISPHSFAAYQTPPDAITSTLTSIGDSYLVHTFGDPKNSNGITTRSVKICSSRYDVCASSSIETNIFENPNYTKFFLLSLLGLALAQLSILAARQIIKTRSSLPNRLLRAIKNKNIYVEYQPIFQASTGQIRGFEALARWKDKIIGQIPPDTFIAEAEKLNVTHLLSRYITLKSLSEARESLKNNSSIYLSINLSAKEILDFRIIHYISKIAQSLLIPNSQIAIEILENSTADLSKLELQIKKIRELGFKIFIDDFGSGYSSLAYLSLLKVDKIKIDRLFTKAAGTDSPASFILIKVCDIIKSLDAHIIFEGIEFEEQKNAILEFCPDALAQGWLFSKAVPISEAVRLLAKNQSSALKSTEDQG